MTKRTRVFSTISFLLIAAASANAQANLITANSAGKVKLGMTIADVRKAVSPMRVSRTSDGEGIALIAVKQGKTDVMTIYAGEEDRPAAIDETARVEQIWVWSKTYKTAADVHPGMLVGEAEKLLGKLKEIVMSEIESREYARFATKPKGMEFRVLGKNINAGVYPPRSNRTTTHTSGAYIFSINVTGRDDSSTGGVARFTSQYTDLKNDCRTVAGNEGGHVSTFCRGPGGYQIHFFDSATTLEFNAENEDREFSVRLASESLDYANRNSKIEWRLADGKPFAVIILVFTYKDDGEFPKQGDPTDEHLVIKGLKGYESLDARIEAKTPDANEKAREAADNGDWEGYYQAHRPNTRGGAVALG